MRAAEGLHGPGRLRVRALLLDPGEARGVRGRQHRGQRRREAFPVAARMLTSRPSASGAGSPISSRNANTASTSASVASRPGGDGLVGGEQRRDRAAAPRPRRPGSRRCRGGPARHRTGARVMSRQVRPSALYSGVSAVQSSHVHAPAGGSPRRHPAARRARRPRCRRRRGARRRRPSCRRTSSCPCRRRRRVRAPAASRRCRRPTRARRTRREVEARRREPGRRHGVLGDEVRGHDAGQRTLAPQRERAPERTGGRAHAGDGLGHGAVQPVRRACAGQRRAHGRVRARSGLCASSRPAAGRAVDRHVAVLRPGAGQRERLRPEQARVVVDAADDRPVRAEVEVDDERAAAEADRARARS
jgi:hypothetical protein